MFSVIKRLISRRRDTVSYQIPKRRRPTTPVAHSIRLIKRQEKALQELKEAGKYGPDQVHTHSQ